VSAPGDGMPVANKSQDQDQGRDKQKTGGFESVDLGDRVPLVPVLIGLRFWSRCGHGAIVVRTATKRWNSVDICCVSMSNGTGTGVLPTGSELCDV
jgi:hypothetical protein